MKRVDSAQSSALANKPDLTAAQVEFISNERKSVIQMLAVTSRKLKSVPNESSEPGKSLLPRLDTFLSWLDDKVTINPELVAKTKIDEGLRLIFEKPDFHFPAAQREKARTLHARWAEQNWGAPMPSTTESSEHGNDEIQGPTRDSQDENQPRKKRRRLSPTTAQLSELNSIKPVPPNHRIWGVDGIMHGVARKVKGARKTMVLNPAYDHEKRDAKVYGHNGLQPGTWFPYQIVALFRGAHGTSQAGISGDPERGAYSIVVSGYYDRLDKDLGQSLYYSGSGSHENTDPLRPTDKTSGTECLHVSRRTGKPVRVLRSASGQSRFAPSAGLRYDGLYTVVDHRLKKNDKGGVYEQFKLERQPNQVDLESLVRRPDARERRDLERVSNGY